MEIRWLAHACFIVFFTRRGKGGREMALYQIADGLGTTRVSLRGYPNGTS